jgi:uncharacterized membrane protein
MHYPETGSGGVHLARAVKAKPARTTQPSTAAAAARAEADFDKVEMAAAARLHRYAPVYVGVALGVVAALVSYFVHRGITLEIGAIVFFLTYLGMTLARLPRLSPAYLRVHAGDSDIPGYVVLLVVIATLIATSVSFFVAVNGGPHPDSLLLVLGVLSLFLGWLTMHGMLAFHYAYEYYGTDETSEPDEKGLKPHVGGLDFPGKERPDALSFLYFSFVVAMTAQVSDVVVTSNAMRRLVLLHGIVSFFFNTVIIAIAVNIVVSLGH